MVWQLGKELWIGSQTSYTVVRQDTSGSNWPRAEENVRRIWAVTMLSIGLSDRPGRQKANKNVGFWKNAEIWESNALQFFRQFSRRSCCPGLAERALKACKNAGFCASAIFVERVRTGLDRAVKMHSLGRS